MKRKHVLVFVSSVLVTTAIAGNIRGSLKIIDQRTFLNRRDTIAASNNKRRELRNVDVNALLRENHITPQYVQQQNSMMTLINKIKPEARNDGIEVYSLPSTDPFSSDEILGRLGGLTSADNKFHTNEGYNLPMEIIDPNYDSLGYQAFDFVDMLGSEAMVHPDIYSYRINPIPEGTVRGSMGILGYTSNIDYLIMSPTIDTAIPDQSSAPSYRSSAVNQSSALSYKVSAFGLIDSVKTDETRINPDAYKPVLRENETLLGMLHGLLGPQTKFQNDQVYVSMDLKEPNFDTIRTSTYLGMINSPDLQTDNRVAKSSFQYKKMSNAAFVGLWGKLGDPDKLEPFLLADIIDRTSSYYSKDETLNLLDLVTQPSRIQSEKYTLPTYMTQPDAPTIVGMIEGKLQDDAMHHYSIEMLKYSVEHYDKKSPSLASGTSKGSRGIGVSFLNIIDKVQGSKYSGVATLVQGDLAGIDYDIQVHVESTIVTPDEDVIRTAVCGSSYGGCPSPTMVHINPTAIAGVRCCSDLEITGWSQSSTCTVWAESIINDECPLNVTYSEAFGFCESQGGRLCTGNELSGDCAAGTGCELDHSMIWSSSASFHVGRSQNVENNGNPFGNKNNKDGTTARAGTKTTLSDVPPEAICLFNSKCAPFFEVDTSRD